MPGESELTDEEVVRLYAALRSVLHDEMSVREARNIASAAGVPIGLRGSYDRNKTLAAIDRSFLRLPPEQQSQTLVILASKLGEGAPDAAKAILQAHGYQFLNGAFVPIGILDAREARHLPTESAAEISKAMTRLVDGDESGAITAACGAVDLVTQRLYGAHGLGDPGTTSFSAKVNTALQRLNVFGDLEAELIDLGMNQEDAESIVLELKKATNHAAQALQVLRRSMGDVHGTRPALRRTAYDAIKWASAICGLLEGL